MVASDLGLKGLAAVYIFGRHSHLDQFIPLHRSQRCAIAGGEQLRVSVRKCAFTDGYGPARYGPIHSAIRYYFVTTGQIMNRSRLFRQTFIKDRIQSQQVRPLVGVTYIAVHPGACLQADGILADIHSFFRAVIPEPVVVQSRLHKDMIRKKVIFCML